MQTEELTKHFESQTFETTPLKDTTYTECTFTKCTFSNVTMHNITFSNCTFDSCALRNVTFRECSMLNGNFENCALMGLDWTPLRRHGARLPLLLKLANCSIKYNTFIDMKLPKMDFSASTIHDCFFQDCDLKQSNFQRCDLQNTTFQTCRLGKSDFREARNYRINILNNTVTKARFSRPDVIGLLSGFDIHIEP